jgi:hypothetical protein
MNRFLIIPICLAVAACATPGGDPQPSKAVEAPESAPATDLPDSDVQAVSDPGMMAVTDSAPNSGGIIEELDSPQVAETPPSMIPGAVEPEPAVVCERVVPTGSIIPTKVCRTREEIDRKESADQEIFDDIKRNTAIFNTRL